MDESADIPMMDDSPDDDAAPQQRFNIADVLAGGGDGGGEASGESVESLPLAISESMRSILFEVDEAVVSERLQRLYPNVDQHKHPLPRNWNNADKCPTLVPSQDLLRVTYKGKGIDYKGSDGRNAGAIRADHPVPKSAVVYYFEVHVTSKGNKGFVGIGLSEKGVQLNRLPGWDSTSYGYHGDDGHFFASAGKGTEYGPRFTAGDTVGCGINFITREIFFTKNGVNLGVAVQNVPLNNDLYPIVGMQSLGEVIDTNFGQKPFLYNIAKDIEEARSSTLEAVNSIELPQEKAIWMDRVISSWLAHEGYSRALEAFNRATGMAAGDIPATGKLQPASLSMPEKCENANSSRRSVVKSVKEAILEEMDNRRQLLRLVQQGKTKEAVEKVEQWYPALLESNKQLNLLLKVQQFVEMLLAISATDDPAVESNPTPFPVTRGSSPGGSQHATFSPFASSGRTSRRVTGSSHSAYENPNDGLYRSGAKRRSSNDDDGERSRYSPRRVHRASGSSRSATLDGSSGIMETGEAHHSNGTAMATNGCGTTIGTPPTSTTIVEEFEDSDNFYTLDGADMMEGASGRHDYYHCGHSSQAKNGGMKEERGVERRLHKYLPLIEFGQSLSQFAARHLSDANSAALRKRMNDAFSLICSPRPFNSDNAYLLSQQQRNLVAKALNAAILEICGKEGVSPLDRQFRRAKFLQERAMAQAASFSSVFANVQCLMEGNGPFQSPTYQQI